MIEKAIILNRVDEEIEDLEKYKRIYFGNEFCERLLPTKDELKQIIDFCLNIDKPLTLITPFLTNNGLAKVGELLETFYNLGTEFWEVVVNDWGLLYTMYKKGYPNIGLGRLLTKQKRGPRIANLKHKLPPTALVHFKRFSVDKPEIITFLRQLGVVRIELDNTLQGVIASSDIPKSIYLPFVYVSTTRYCLISKLNKKDFKLRRIDDCNKECLNRGFVLKNKYMPEKIYLKGNTQFYKNDRLPDKLEDKNIDRIVYQE